MKMAQLIEFSHKIKLKIYEPGIHPTLPIIGRIHTYKLECNPLDTINPNYRIGEVYTHNFRIESGNLVKSEDIINSDMYELDPSPDTNSSYNHHIKTGDLVRYDGNFYYCRSNGSTLYLYSSVDDLENKRNRNGCVARNRVEKYSPKAGVVVRKVTLNKDLLEESDPEREWSD